MRMFLDGGQLGVNYSTTQNFSNTNLLLGNLVGGSEPFTGYLSNFRVVVGNTVTGIAHTFTPPTLELLG